MLKIFNISELQAGMMVNKVVSQHGPVKIRTVGIIRSPEMVKGLKEMGVTEVEVDLSQSLGIIDEDATPAAQAELKKLTPTQQLLQNERQLAKKNSDGSQQFHRSLFMPSMDSLPSFWSLYGKNAALLSIFIVVGFLIGWNIVAVPQWLSLIQGKNDAVIAYPLINEQTDGSAASIDSATTNMPEPVLDAGNPQQLNTESLVSELPSTINNNLAKNDAATQTTQQLASETISGAQAEEQELLVLGYQPDNRVRQLNPIRTSGPQSQNLLTDPQGAVEASVMSAELIDKINQAIADLDDESSGDLSKPQANGFEDLPRIDQLSVAIQTQLPSMAFSAHMYSSKRDSRWVRVNGRRLIEGDYIGDELQLVNIEPQTVVLMFKGEVFTMNAMTDW